MINRGYAMFYGGNLVGWSAQKHGSSTKSKYNTLANAIVELIWVQALLEELGISHSCAPILWRDNTLATCLVFHACTKHIKVDFHLYENGLLQIKFISFKNELADIFTKPLPLLLFSSLISAILTFIDRLRWRVTLVENGPLAWTL
jgi:hypothetical protein